MKKEQLFKKLYLAWTMFQESYSDLSDEQLLEPGITGDWSVKDIIAHVTTWEEESLKHLPEILKGNQPPRYSDQYGGIDAFNAQMTEQKRSLSLPEIVHQMEVTHQRLLDYIQTVPDEHFTTETRFRRRLRLDTYSHYPIHTNLIREWREKNA